MTEQRCIRAGMIGLSILFGVLQGCDRTAAKVADDWTGIVAPLQVASRTKKQMSFEVANISPVNMMMQAVLVDSLGRVGQTATFSLAAGGHWFWESDIDSDFVAVALYGINQQHGQQSECAESKVLAGLGYSQQRHEYAASNTEVGVYVMPQPELRSDARGGVKARRIPLKMSRGSACEAKAVVSLEQTNGVVLGRFDTVGIESIDLTEPMQRARWVRRSVLNRDEFMAQSLDYRRRLPECGEYPVNLGVELADRDAQGRLTGIYVQSLNRETDLFSSPLSARPGDLIWGWVDDAGQVTCIFTKEDLLKRVLESAINRGPSKPLILEVVTPDGARSRIYSTYMFDANLALRLVPKASESFIIAATKEITLGFGASVYAGNGLDADRRQFAFENALLIASQAHPKSYNAGTWAGMIAPTPLRIASPLAKILTNTRVSRMIVDGTVSYWESKLASRPSIPPHLSESEREEELQKIGFTSAILETAFRAATSSR